jgi:hypothetical protein
MTTLTVPGAVPAGIPGSGAPRPKGPGNTLRGPGGGPGKKHGRGNRRHGPKPGGNVAVNDAAPKPAIIDDDFGNR